MNNRYDIAKGEIIIPPADPNTIELKNTTQEHIAEAIIKKLSPKNGDVFFIASEGVKDWDTLYRALSSTLTALKVTCGVVITRKNIEIKKEALGDVVTINFDKDETANGDQNGREIAAIEDKIRSEILVQNRKPA